jgi:hypothetical protein
MLARPVSTAPKVPHLRRLLTSPSFPIVAAVASLPVALAEGSEWVLWMLAAVIAGYSLSGSV